MKKMMLVLMVLVAGATATYAINPVESRVFATFNNEPVFNRLVKYLDADGEQADNLKYVLSETETKMKTAEQNGNDAAFEKALYFNLANARSILSRSQYIKYLSMINLTVTNRTQEELLSER